MFCFKSILQIWIILIGFRDTNNFVNLGLLQIYHTWCTSAEHRFYSHKNLLAILLIFLFSLRQLLFCRLSQVEGGFVSLFVIEKNKDQTLIRKAINDDNASDVLPQLAVTAG